MVDERNIMVSEENKSQKKIYLVIQFFKTKNKKREREGKAKQSNTFFQGCKHCDFVFKDEGNCINNLLLKQYCKPPPQNSGAYRK